jgi:hypothetical protein
MVIDFLVLPNYASGDIHPASGQFAWNNSVVVFTSFSSYRVGASPSRTMSWSLGTSQQWILAAVSVKGYSNLYLEHAASIAKHGRHYLPWPAGSFRALESVGYRNSANTLYDAAANELNLNNDGSKHYELKMAYVPGSPTNWLPGDTVETDYRTPQLTIQEPSLIVTERIQEFDDENVRHWSFVLSNQPVLLPRQAQALAKLQERMAAIQSSQV